MDAPHPHQGWHLQWEKGGTARVVSLAAAKDAITLRSSIPSPPGSRIDGTLLDGGTKVRFKIHGSKKQDDGEFVLEGRTIDMTREVRERLASLVAPVAPA